MVHSKIQGDGTMWVNLDDMILEIIEASHKLSSIDNDKARFAAGIFEGITKNLSELRSDLLLLRKVNG